MNISDRLCGRIISVLRDGVIALEEYEEDMDYKFSKLTDRMEDVYNELYTTKE